MKVKQHFKSGKQVAVYATLLLIVLMSLGSCKSALQERYEEQAVLIDSLSRELIRNEQYDPIISFPLIITTISNDGYSVAVDAAGDRFLIDCNPEDYSLNQKIGE